MISALAVSLILSQAAATAPAAPVLTFDEAMQQAASKNLDLQVARARLTQADEISRKAWSGYLPNLSVGGTYTYNSSTATLSMPTLYVVRDTTRPVGPPSGPDTGLQTTYIAIPDPESMIELELQKEHMFNGQAQLQQALIVPQLWPAIHGATLAERAAKLNVENARREILFATAQLYYSAEGLREAVEVQRQLLELNRQHERDAELKFKVGEAPRVALLRAQIERARSEQDVRRTEVGYASAKSALATLLNREPDFEVAPPPKPQLDDRSMELTQKALELRPDVQAARVNVELAQSQRTSTLMKYLPSLFGFARLSASNAAGFAGDTTTWVAGAQLQWNLFDGGLREAEFREASARIVEQRAASEAAADRAVDEVRRAMYDLESAEANLVKAEEQLKLARENSELVNKSFEAGVASYIEVLDANGALTGAALNRINEQLSSHLAVLKLAKAAGLFDPLKKEAQ